MIREEETLRRSHVSLRAGEVKIVSADMMQNETQRYDVKMKDADKM